MNDTSHLKPPPERSFGLLFTAVFIGLGLFGIWKKWGQNASLAWIVAGVIVALVTLLAPRLLAPFNMAWFKLGLLLSKIVSPLVLGIIFFGILTPVAFVMRIAGRDVLRLKRLPSDSYWVARTPPGPAPDSFKNQF